MDDTISRQDFDKCLEEAEKEAVKNRKYVFASALNTIRGNLRNFPSAQTDSDTDLERLSSGTWDAKELPTTQPDKIEVHLQELSSAQPKPLKYSGTSICCYCKTTDCDGCLYEPMAERREE